MKTAKFYAFRFRIDTDHDDHEEMARVIGLAEECPGISDNDMLELYRRLFEKHLQSDRCAAASW